MNSANNDIGIDEALVGIHSNSLTLIADYAMNLATRNHPSAHAPDVCHKRVGYMVASANNAERALIVEIGNVCVLCKRRFVELSRI